MKICTKCKEEKAECEFSPDKRKGDGLYGRCKTCRREDGCIYRKANKVRLKEARKKKSKRNVERAKQWKEKDNNRFKTVLWASKHHAKKYGHVMCSATVDELTAAFAGKCDACGVPEIELTRKLCVDHSHETGFFRGFLCHKCNKALGLLGDSEEIIVNLLHHLMNGVKRE